MLVFNLANKQRVVAYGSDLFGMPNNAGILGDMFKLFITKHRTSHGVELMKDLFKRRPLVFDDPPHKSTSKHASRHFRQIPVISDSLEPARRPGLG